MNLSGDFAFLNFVVPNRLHAGGHQVWQLLKEQTDASAPTGFMPVEAGFDNFEHVLRFRVAKPGFHRREVGWGAALSGLAWLVAKPWSAGVKPAGPQHEVCLDSDHYDRQESENPRIYSGLDRSHPLAPIWDSRTNSRSASSSGLRPPSPPRSGEKGHAKRRLTMYLNLRI